MRVRVIGGAALLFGVLAAANVITTWDVHAFPARQSAIVFLKEPTLLGDTVVQGPVLFTHDEAKMRRGEPCTTIYLFEPGKGALDEVVSFHCIPRPRRVVGAFTIRTRPNDRIGFGCVLTEYQFAGDDEGHGVPTPADGH